MSDIASAPASRLPRGKTANPDAVAKLTALRDCLVAARKTQGMTQAGLAERLGVGIHTVRRWEGGRYLETMPAAQLWAWAQVVGFHFLGIAVAPSKDNPQQPFSIAPAWPVPERAVVNHHLMHLKEVLGT